MTTGLANSVDPSAIRRELSLTLADGRAVKVPSLQLSDFGDKGFLREHGLDYPYMAGAMAHGIASVDLVVAMAREGMLGSFGAAGLGLDKVAQAIDALQEGCGTRTFAVNFIHSPQEPQLEDKLCDLLHAKNVHLVEASAFMRLTKALVRYRVKGLQRLADGTIEAPYKIIAKVSRVEVAKFFWSPAPLALLDELLHEGAISEDQHRLAQQLPMAYDLTVEADSGGHTDNRPLVTLMPQMLALKTSLEKQFQYPTNLRLGAAGGLATPHAVLAAFTMGAAYVVTGTINQACLESGTSPTVREMLAQTEQGDTIMAPAADMFEMGVKVQVLKRGTMFAMRAQRLYEYYRQYPSLEAIPDSERKGLEDSVFRQPLLDAWRDTERYFQAKDPSQLRRAETHPKHKMSLLFRSYLGQASHWATRGVADRRIDFQVWCGPAMAAFNDWVRGSCLQDPAARRVADVAQNLLFGAAVLQRLHVLRLFGQALPDEESYLRPRTREDIHLLLQDEGT